MDAISGKTLGEKIKERREQLGLKLGDLAREIRISPKIIESLEEDNYESFSAKVYAAGFLKKILAALYIENGKPFLEELDDAWNAKKETQLNSLQLENKKAVFANFYPRMVLGLTLAALFLLFLVIKIEGLLAPPRLKLKDFKEAAKAINTPQLHVQGNGGKENRLTINDRDIKISEQGDFDENIELQAGLNILEFVLQNKFGKESREIKYVVAE